VSDQRQTQPNGRPTARIAYISDYDGDEQGYFLVSPKTGQVINITNTREIRRRVRPGRQRSVLALHGEAHIVGVRNRHLRHPDARHQHLTSGTPGQDECQPSYLPTVDRHNQQQAKGTDSNIFIAEVATGKNTLLTPHQGEQLYTVNEISPDGKRC
jgi:hypothetical protein